MSDDKSPGTAKSPRLIKAGCGFRYDPDDLPPETGFDFEAARKLLNQQQPEEVEKQAEKDGDHPPGLQSEPD